MKSPSDLKSGRRKWIGVDFDGTLAHHEPGESLDILGEPIAPMVELVQCWISLGWVVKVFTARVSSMYEDADVQRSRIKWWCRKHIGVELDVTAEKDGAMEELWDDRAVSVERNTGRWASMRPHED